MHGTTQYFRVPYSDAGRCAAITAYCGTIKHLRRHGAFRTQRWTSKRRSRQNSRRSLQIVKSLFVTEWPNGNGRHYDDARPMITGHSVPLYRDARRVLKRAFASLFMVGVVKKRKPSHLTKVCGLRFTATTSAIELHVHLTSLLSV